MQKEKEKMMAPAQIVGYKRLVFNPFPELRKMKQHLVFY